jgi:predicted DNA-binding transcriptional regulator AlpA
MKYYKSNEIADMLNLTTQTLMLWRKKGIGPKWVKLGQNIVRYPMYDFKKWMYDRYNKSAQQDNNNTKQP